MLVLITQYHTRDQIRRIRRTGHVARVGRRDIYKVFMGESEGTVTLGRPRSRWEHNIQTDEMKRRGLDSFCSGQGHVVGFCDQGAGSSGSINAEYLISSGTSSFQEGLCSTNSVVSTQPVRPVRMRRCNISLSMSLEVSPPATMSPRVQDVHSCVHYPGETCEDLTRLSIQ